MSSIEEQVRQVLLGDPSFMALVPDGAAGLLGGDNTVIPPAPNQPSWYVELSIEFRTSIFANDVEGTLRLRGYDYPHSNYRRIRLGLLRADRVLREHCAAIEDGVGDWALFADDETGEAIYGLGTHSLGDETADQTVGLLTQAIEWPVRKTA